MVGYYKGRIASPPREASAFQNLTESIQTVPVTLSSNYTISTGQKQVVFGFADEGSACPEDLLTIARG